MQDLGDCPAWYVVRTKRYGERLAHVRLGERAIDSYLPLIVEWPRPAVGSDIQPLFPGYLFVRGVLPGDFYRIARCQGVQGFVTVGGIPGTVGEEVIEFLRASEGANGLITPGSAPPSRKVVRINAGVFAGLTAVLERRIPARGRAVVLLQLLQRETSVELPDKWISQA